MNGALLFLDTEFNELHGELISMAIVPERGEPFYEVIGIPERPGPFVVEHVLPKLEKEPIGEAAFRTKLMEFLSGFDDPMVIADWPADFEHLCRQLTSHAALSGTWVTPLIKLRLIDTPKLEPKTPHNALSDATALRDWWTGK